jgi:hypothetical protein
MDDCLYRDMMQKRAAFLEQHFILTWADGYEEGSDAVMEVQ